MTKQELESLFDEAVAALDSQLDDQEAVLGQQAFAIYKRNCQMWVDFRRRDWPVLAVNTMPEVCADVVNNLSVNSLASEHRGAYFGGIDYGTTMVPKVMFSLLLSSPKILPDIGGAAFEAHTAPLPLVPVGLNDLLNHGGQSDQGLPDGLQGHAQPTVKAALAEGAGFYLDGMPVDHVIGRQAAAVIERPAAHWTLLSLDIPGLLLRVMRRRA